MVRTRQAGEAARGLRRRERIYWKPFILLLIKTRIRAVVKLLQQEHPETSRSAVSISASVIGSTTIGGLFPAHRHIVKLERAWNDQTTARI